VKAIDRNKGYKTYLEPVGSHGPSGILFPTFPEYQWNGLRFTYRQTGQIQVTDPAFPAPFGKMDAN